MLYIFLNIYLSGRHLAICGRAIKTTRELTKNMEVFFTFGIESGLSSEN